MVSCLCIPRGQLTFLSLKCKNDIQAIFVVLTDPERQKHSRTAQNSSCKQKWFTYRQKWLQICSSLIFGCIFCCHATLTFAVWHFSRCDTRANIRSVKQYQICLGLLPLMCVVVSVCEQSRRISWNLSLVCVGVIRRECLRKMLPRRLGWQASSTVFHCPGFKEKKMEVGRVLEKLLRLEQQLQPFLCHFSHADNVKFSLMVVVFSKQGPF